MGRSAALTRTAALAVLAIALLAAGLWLGSMLRGDEVDRLAPDGALIEIHLADGTVYLGSVESEGEYLVVSSPAMIVPGPTEGDAASYSVEPLSGEPYSILGPILVERSRVAFIGVVGVGSPIDVAYQEAMTVSADTTPAPS